MDIGHEANWTANDIPIAIGLIDTMACIVRIGEIDLDDLIAGCWWRLATAGD